MSGDITGLSLNFHWWMKFEGLSVCDGDKIKGLKGPATLTLRLA